MKVIVAGGRDFIPTKAHRVWLVHLLSEILHADTIICGMARGADMFGFETACELGLKVLEFPANWDLFGKSAGYLRNEEMAKVADVCVLFPGGKGTQHMKDIATKYKLKVYKYD